jgi:hypothetical protein
MYTSEEKKEADKILFFLTRFHSKSAKGAAVSYIRIFTNMKEPLRASEKAVQKAKDMNLNLRNLTWANQPKFDKNREIFHYEHLWTVTDIINQCKKANTEEEVSKILDKLEVVWILKEEDKNLKKTDRQDPEEEYAKAGITLISIHRIWGSVI